MLGQRKIHLFNCDQLYELSIIENLLNSSKPKLAFDFTVKYHYFSLSETAELSEKVIAALQIDFAFFVVHAHESCLSINDGRGYTKVYRALLQKTGGNLITVIGGDDNYKSEDEEERSVISPWVRRIVSVQFSEEYLDGRKSFVFSWNKKHRPIHEEALKHFFDPSKNGEKFEYQLSANPDPPSQARRVTPAETIPTKAEENKCSSDIGKITQEKAETPAYTQRGPGPFAGKLLFKSKLRHGRISYAPEDVEFSSPHFLGLPDDKKQRYLDNYSHIDEIQLKIVSGRPGDSVLVLVGDQGIEMGNNDLLLLKIRVIKGLVSFCEDDIEFQYPGWKVPLFILEDLKRKSSTGRLFIISDERGNLRCKVKREVADKLADSVAKFSAILRSSNAFK